MVRVAENLTERFSVQRVDRRRTLGQACSEQRMRQIGARLIDTFEGVVLGCWAEAQSPDLREDEPQVVC